MKADDERTWQNFLRQRRNLIAISLVLTFAQVSDLTVDKLNFLGNEVKLGTPVAVLYALWIAWGCWLWRYFVYWQVTDKANYKIEKQYRFHQLSWLTKKVVRDKTLTERLIKPNEQFLNLSIAKLSASLGQ